MKKKTLLWGILVIWITSIVIATRLPILTGQSTAILLQTPYVDMSSFNFLVRKAVHFTVFGTLAILFWLTFSTLKYKYAIAFLLSITIGAVDEWHQSFIPGRTASVADVCINAAGVCTFLTVLYIVKSRKTDILSTQPTQSKTDLPK